MIDPTDEGGKYFAIMGEFAACEDCASFVLACLPGWMFDDVIEYKNKDEDEATSITHAMSIFGREDKTASKPCMLPASKDSLGFEIYEKKCILNHFQVVTEFKKLPTSLKLKAYWAPTATGKNFLSMRQDTTSQGEVSDNKDFQQLQR